MIEEAKNSLLKFGYNWWEFMCDDCYVYANIIDPNRKFLDNIHRVLYEIAANGSLESVILFYDEYYKSHLSYINHSAIEILEKIMYAICQTPNDLIDIIKWLNDLCISYNNTHYKGWIINTFEQCCIHNNIKIANWFISTFPDNNLTILPEYTRLLH